MTKEANQFEHKFVQCETVFFFISQINDLFFSKGSDIGRVGLLPNDFWKCQKYRRGTRMYWIVLEINFT